MGKKRMVEGLVQSVANQNEVNWCEDIGLLL